MRNVGKYGEDLAVGYLHNQGYDIITRNWYCKFGEIDIVAEKKSSLVFVEVRSRRATSTEFAFASITPHKQEKLIKSVYQYLAHHDLALDVVWRIDVVAIALSRQIIIEHVEDAFDW